MTEIYVDPTPIADARRPVHLIVCANPTPGSFVKGGDKPGHRTAGAVPSGAE